jgi:hypothetical protein
VLKRQTKRHKEQFYQKGEHEQYTKQEKKEGKAAVATEPY